MVTTSSCWRRRISTLDKTLGSGSRSYLNDTPGLTASNSTCPLRGAVNEQVREQIKGLQERILRRLLGTEESIPTTSCPSQSREILHAPFFLIRVGLIFVTVGGRARDIHGTEAHGNRSLDRISPVALLVRQQRTCIFGTLELPT
jgi:hypothetical protein